MNRFSTPESWAIRKIGAFLSGSGKDGSLIVLIYHRVLAAADPLLVDEPTAERFAAQMDLVASHFNVLPLAEAVRRLSAGDLPPRALCITFDDGYSNNFHVALPILVQHRLPATIFVAPGFLGHGRMFNDTIIEAIRRAPDELDLREAGFGILRFTDLPSRRAAIEKVIGALKYLDIGVRESRAQLVADIVGTALPSDLMMTAAEVREAHGHGIEIGAHTVNHPVLAKTNPPEAAREILESRLQLEDIIRAPVTSFAYPNGRPERDYGSQHVSMVQRAGFDLAVSTAWGAASIESDILQLPRIAPWDRHPIRFVGRLLRAYRERRFPTAHS